LTERMVRTGTAARTSGDMQCAVIDRTTRTKEERPTPLSGARGGKQGLA
jgi:hypothetical protein